ncbi:MAG TPA: RsmE family RNA methyltransferase, partial [Candidatus Paceibacterota bacterium]|nr:RsmE family RNA methyltransferase [Candidatus Paceibacterota bacterium]
IKNVLRLKVGDSLILCDGQNGEAEVVLKDFGKNSVEVEIVSFSNNTKESLNKISLYCAILKRENFELVVQKATEIGVFRIIPLITKRTVKLSLKKERLWTIAKEAAEQSGRGIIPEIASPMEFSDAVKDADNLDAQIMFDLSDLSASNNILNKAQTIGIFIGPEGGWDEQEILLAKKSGFSFMNLGSFVLRAETAAIVAVYKTIHLED